MGQVTLAGPVFAHAELVSSTPANGERLRDPPTEVTLQFTERVGLIEGGIQLLDADTGDVVATGKPRVDDTVVHWPMPTDLPAGAYLVNWRVISTDTHPVSGAFSFGIGTDVSAVQSTTASTNGSWPVITARWLGYLGFALVTGVVAFALLCWPPARGDARARRLLNVGLALAAVATVLGLLLQGPYVAGTSEGQLLDPDLIAETAHTAFGAWMQIRLVLYFAVAAVLWTAGSLQLVLNRWIAGLGIVGLAVTFSATGHAAAGNLLDRAVDSLHLLTAGMWVGGLLSIVALSTAQGNRPSRDGIARFSRLALVAVLTLIATGTISALLRLSAIEDLWQSTYGRLLLIKLTVVLVALAGAAVSRRSLQRGDMPWKSVRVEASATVVVLAVTAVLTLTAPPSTMTSQAMSQGSATHKHDSTGSDTVTMTLGKGRTALLHVDGLSTHGSALHLELLGSGQEPLPAVKDVTLQATLPARSLGPLDVALRQDPAGWLGDFRFPLAGEWKLTLTVEDRHLNAVVTGGDLTISQ